MLSQHHNIHRTMNPSKTSVVMNPYSMTKCKSKYIKYGHLTWCCLDDHWPLGHLKLSKQHPESYNEKYSVMIILRQSQGHTRKAIKHLTLDFLSDSCTFVDLQAQDSLLMEDGHYNNNNR